VEPHSQPIIVRRQRSQVSFPLEIIARRKDVHGLCTIHLGIVGAL
jgi:hypothetical protein